jgi:hypothetical protein
MTDILNNSANDVKIVFQCDHCDKAFARNSSLQVHINTIHKKIKRFGCDQCDYTSYSRSSLKKHSNNIHLGKKDFKCDHCDKA